MAESSFITDLLTPGQLTASVQQAMTGGLPFDNIITTKQTDNIKQQVLTADFTASAEVARYRNWDTRIDIGRRPGFSLAEYEIAPLGWSYRLNEEDLLRFSNLRRGVASVADQSVVGVMFNDALRAGEAILNRITLLHGELLTTGVVTLDELGNPVAGQAIKVTFPVPANQMGVVPAGTAWSTIASSVPLVDLVAWEAIYRANNGGQGPAAWGVSEAVLANLTMNASLINRAFPYAGAALPAQISNELIAATLRANGVRAPLVVINDIERPALDGSGSAKVISDRFVIGFTPGMAATYFAPPPVLAVLEGNAQIEQSAGRGIVAYSVTDIRPPSVITTAEAVALPLLEKPTQLFVASV